MISSGKNPTFSVSSLYALLQMLTLFSTVVAYPSSSNAIITTAAPYFYIMLAFAKKSSSPSFSEMELTTHLPWQF